MAKKPKTGDSVAVGRRIAQTRGTTSRRIFAEKIGLPRVATSLVRYESGERETTPELLTAIARAYGVSADWLLSGIGIAPASAAETASADAREDETIVKIKQLSARLGAGEGDDAEDTLVDPYPLRLEDARALGFPRVRLRAASVAGNSMEPVLSDGDTVIVASDTQARDGICAIALGGNLRVKTIQAGLGGRFKIVSANPEYPTLDAGPEDDVRVIGRVVMTIRKRV